MKTSKEGNSKRETPIWKAEVRKHVNIAMSDDLSFLLRIDKEQNKGKNPLDLVTGRGKRNKQTQVREKISNHKIEETIISLIK